MGHFMFQMKIQIESALVFVLPKNRDNNYSLLTLVYLNMNTHA